MNIRIYLSKQGYDAKPKESAGIIKMINSYELVDIDIETLYKKLINGHFIHHECGYSPSSTGGKAYTFKKSLLKQTQIMCVDFDYKIKDTKKDGTVIEKHYEPNEMPNWNNELLSNLKYKNWLGDEIDISPTFWMESFSAHKSTLEKIVGNSIHMFYVFDTPICNVYDFEKVATTIIFAIYKALQYRGYNIPLEKERCPFDPVSTDMFQGLWGSNDKACGYNGKVYSWGVFKQEYKPEIKDIIFKVKSETNEEATDEEIKRTISAYSTVKTIDDIDIDKSKYIKYKKYFGHEETFHIISVLKHEYSLIEEQVNNKQSLCYQVCKKLLLGHSNDFFDENESTFYHEYKRCKIYIKKGTNEAAYMSHVIKLIGDTGAIPMIEYKQKEDKYGNTVKLSKSEYLSDKKEEIASLFDDEKINFLIAAPGLGKTVFAKSLKGRTLIIELFNSIIQSEDKFPAEDFIKFYGNNYINENSIGKMNVCSANKFVTWYKGIGKYQYNEFLNDNCLFDNVILDESHLLCLSNYRYDIMGETVECIKNLKREYPNTNVILMTGTPFGEESIFDDLNIVKVDAEPRYTQKFHMIQTTSIVGYIKELIKNELAKGLRVFIPVDSENWFDTFIESCVEDGIISKDKTYYFNQPKNNEDIEQSILNTKLIGDIQILGTSSYMSVGIDLEDWKTPFTTIIPSGASVCGNFSGIEVQQFANRHRKQNLEVYYVISNNEDNTKKPVLTSSCRALLNIKNDILKSMYRTNPIIINIPRYLKSEDELLKLNEDMFNVFIYYQDMKSIITHPAIIYEYMQNIGWECNWETVTHAERGLNTKEHKDQEKLTGVSEFMTVLNEWSMYNYPIIKVKDSIQPSFEMTTHKSPYSLFDAEYIEVGFTNYYAKNTLFGMLLNLREYLTGKGAFNLIKDAYGNDKINMTFIRRTLLAIKIINTYKKTEIWNILSQRLQDFYSDYSGPEDYVYSENKDDFNNKRNQVIQDIWDELCLKVDDDLLKMALETNYNNLTNSLIENFIEGVKLVQVMYLKSRSFTKKINGKIYKVTMYSWDKNALENYEIRNDIKIK